MATPQGKQYLIARFVNEHNWIHDFMQNFLQKKEREKNIKEGCGRRKCKTCQFEEGRRFIRQVYLNFLVLGGLLTHYSKLETLSKGFWQVNVRKNIEFCFSKEGECSTSLTKIERKPPLKLLHLGKCLGLESDWSSFMNMRNSKEDVLKGWANLLLSKTSVFTWCIPT